MQRSSSLNASSVDGEKAVTKALSTLQQESGRGSGGSIDTSLVSDNDSSLDIKALALDSQNVENVAEGITAMLSSRKLHRDYEKAILQALSSSDSLNELVGLLDWKCIFDRFRNHTSTRQNHRADLFKLLAETRAGDLIVESKVAIMLGVFNSKHKTTLHSQQFVLRLVKACDPKDVYDLKNKLELSSSNIVRVTAVNISDPDIRRELVEFLQTSAVKLLHTGFRGQLRILSDIDDTFIHSGLGLGGPKYPKGTVMPGVRTLFKQLDARVAFVTARPSFVESLTFRHLRDRYEVPATVLCGKLADSLLIPFVPNYCNAKISARKFKNFVKYSMMFPECDFVWFGDSGQGDILTAKEMLQARNKTFERFGANTSVLGAFIQDVVLDDGIRYKTPAEERTKLRSDRIFVVDNYLEVALIMHAEMNILSPDGLFAVASAAVTDFAEAQRQYTPQQELIRAARCREMHEQLEKINLYLEPFGHETISLPRELAVKASKHHNPSAL